MMMRTYSPTQLMTAFVTRLIRKEGDKYVYGKYVERQPVIDGYADTYEEAARLNAMDTPPAADLRPSWFK